MPDKVKFLLVDDIEENLIALEALLRRDDLEILTASSGTQALEILLAHDIALAFIDVQMPEMDGFELAELMRGSQRSKDVPIIFVTAGSRESYRIFRGYESGAVDFLFKPIDAHILYQKANTFFQLYRQRQQLSEQLQRIQENEAQLQQAVQTRDDVLAIVSHDLRNPLGVVKVTTSLLMRTATGDDAPRVKSLCERILRSTDLMNRMIGDLMDMASIRTGRLAFELKPEAVPSLISDAMALQEPFAREKSLELTQQTEVAGLQIDCDRERILQVFSNLIGNAIKFCTAGAGVDVKAQREGNEVHFSVADRGCGISAAELPHVFDPYWSGKSHEQSGTGLGLYITKGIIDAHGGRIWIESEAGIGTTVHFAIPLSETV